MKNNKPNYEELTELITSGVEVIYQQAVTKHASENFYALVLVTYCDPNSVGVCMNSSENYKKIVEAAGIRNDQAKAEEYSQFDYYKWGWMEWGAYEYIGNQMPLDAVGKWLERAYNSFSYTDDGEDWFDLYVDNVHGAMTESLRRLDENGIFGKGAVRDKIFLFCGIYDGDTKLVHKSAKALNSEQNWLTNSPSLITGLALDE